MMRVELSDAIAPLSDFARKARRQTVVITRRGRPVAVLRAVTKEDWEDLVVSTSPAFLRMMKRSHERFSPGSGISIEEIEREFGIRSTKSRRRRSARSSR
jgi:prevent-host-death family protein